MEADVCPMQKYIDIPWVLSVKDPKLWMLKCSIGHEREAVRGMGLLIDLEGPMIPIPLINIMKEDSIRETVIGNISILIKDQARCGRGRSSRRNDDDDRRIKDDATKMQMDTEPDRVRKEIVKKEQAAEDIMPPNKQQSVPGRDTGES